jgi:Tol biopolymer transport system component
MKFQSVTVLFSILIMLFAHTGRTADFNAFGLKLYTVETPHFKIHYHEGLAHLVKPVADKFEFLYGIYAKTYSIKLPTKTDVLLVNSDESNGLTFTNINFILLAIHDFDYNLRGTHDWFDDVITHEYAHMISIPTAFKFKPWIPYIQLGYFTHPNEPERVEALHVIPGEILPMWLTEGIAQYESSRHGSDSWDTHRDMVLRCLTLSGKVLSWDHMQIFAGRGDNFEKTYDHGFSMVRYIAEQYGYDKIVAMVRESSKLKYFNFDAVIDKALGIPPAVLYKEWQSWLSKRYTRQRDSLGMLVTGKKINKDGFDNFWPRFSPDGKKVYFLSNGKNDYSFKNLFSYALADSIKEEKKIKFALPIRGFYDINPASGRIAFTSLKSSKSSLSPRQGGERVRDLFTETLPPDKKPFRLFPKKTEKQVTVKQGIFSGSFSPSGDRLVVARRDRDRFFLGLVDTSGKNATTIYPDTSNGAQSISYIYSVQWSPDGKRIAFSYFDRNDRKIGLYDTTDHTVSIVCDTKNDERDPFWGPGGKQLYFASDRTGIFNIYCHDFESGSLSRITNVLGGAFAPAVSPDGKKLVYAGYDSSGYGIFLVDSIKALADGPMDSALIPRPPLPRPAPTPISYPSAKSYVHKLRQFLCIPTALVEQLVSTESNVFAGSSRFKAGAIMNWMEPASWMGKGSEIGGYFLFEPHHFYNFIDIDNRGINIERNYDVGLFGSTRLLPLTLSFDYLLRGIAGNQSYFDEIEGTNQILPYNVSLQNLTVLISNYFGGGGALGSENEELSLHLLGGLEKYDVTVLFENHHLDLPIDHSYRAGCMANMNVQAIDSRASISPRGIAAKLQYNAKRLFSVSQENTLNDSYYSFFYNEILGHIKSGISAPWYQKHDIHLEAFGNAIKSIRQDTLFPSFNLPVIWLPGYTYYFRTTKPQNNDTTEMVFDTVLITGNTVLSGALSYRFPLSPPLIDKRVWIIYLEKLYGCLNLSGGAGFDRPSRFLEFNRDDWLVSYGAELRLQASTFNGMPLAVKLRWDRGIDRPAPVGGDRFTFGIGFDFDNWGLIMLPDYRAPQFN